MHSNIYVVHTQWVVKPENTVEHAREYFGTVKRGALMYVPHTTDTIRGTLRKVALRKKRKQVK
jgi:hypothetical protein